jgi:Ca-activated chloride channel family protein
MTVRTGVIEVFEDAAQPEPDSGLGALRTERGNLPLELVEVRSSVAGLAVRTELAQGFRNPYDVPLEATYIFPLPDRAAVTRLRMEAADRVVEGVVKEREAARADYDAAISEGKRASIAEEERPGVFTLRVGNILPGERVVIRTTLAGRLPYEDGQATFRFPLVVAPRYIPGDSLPGEQVGSGTAVDTDQAPDASRISPPVLLPGFPNPVRLSIEVAVDPAGLPLAGLTSSLHGVSVEETEGAESAEGTGGTEGAGGTEDTDKAGSRHLVRLNPGARADRDFVLRLGYGGSAAVTSLAVARDEAAAGESSAEGEPSAENATGTGTFLLTVLPPEPTGATRPRDVALVLDRSGSMGGWKMTAARRAAARIVDTLTAADRFAVLTFDHEVDVPDGLPSGVLAAATDRHRFRAVQHLASVEARGGTEMTEPLERAAALLSADGAPDRDRVLILVTDGQVGNEDALLAALGKRLGTLRVHTVGIDSAVNAGFLRRLASVGGGHCELVESEDRLDEAMDAIHRRVGTPLVTGLRVVGSGGLAVDQDSVTPARLPDLFSGAPVVVAGRWNGAGARIAPGAGSGTGTGTGTGTGAGPDADAAAGTDTAPDGEPALIVTGLAADGSAWTRRVPAVEVADAGLAQFWARGRIRDLEDRYASTYQGEPEIEQAIIATSVGFSVLSRFTAFVAVDSRVVTQGGELKQVTQPVDLPDGWDPFAGGGAVYGGAMPLAASSPPAPAGPSGAPMAFGASADLSLSVESKKSVRRARDYRSVSLPAQPAPKIGEAFSGIQPQAAAAPAPAPGSRAPRSIRPAGPASAAAQQLGGITPEPDRADDLVKLAELWLPRLIAAQADTPEKQEALLTEFATELREAAAHAPVSHLTDVTDLLSVLTDAAKPVAERLQSALTFLESVAPAEQPRRRPFWKR